MRCGKLLLRVAILAAILSCTVAVAMLRCVDCEVQDVWLGLPDGTRIFGRLYVPPHPPDRRPLPAVVVCHGYLANLGFMESPWAADLAKIGVVSLFIDRRGHGRSGGTWWPADEHTDSDNGLTGASLDVAAAVDYLRGRGDLVDPDRIALLGHSDGGTAVLMRGSADWRIPATVSLGASMAPWRFVNHFAPSNLLLIYGAEDHFVLRQTDRFLIRSATRGYLDGAGAVGEMANGSARALLRVQGFGHVDLLFSEVARREALRWIAQTLDVDGEVPLAPTRVRLVIVGSILLGMLLLFWNGVPSWTPLRAVGLARSGAVLTAWVSALAVAAACLPYVRSWIPAREVEVVVSILAAELVILGVGVYGLGFIRGREKPLRRNRQWTGACFRGLLVGAGFQVILECLLGSIYETPLNERTIVLTAAFFVLAVPVFTMLSATVSWAAGGADAGARALLTYVPVAVATAGLALPWFPRMSSLPVFLLASAVALMGAYRAGGHRGEGLGAAVFGAVVYARTVSLVCPLY